jgi:hypothetical protein
MIRTIVLIDWTHPICIANSFAVDAQSTSSLAVNAGAYSVLDENLGNASIDHGS